ncbi:hypothetical protein SAMN04488057_10185 [Cyclobacterium lianum]|uniref:Lipocalin-like domain-containing protein n=1 Tax=Cyclobacterium lianum TaxID=388280 RepID=A0A1M7HW69_9BACT|nr:hypothetical protein [Cyclobacterium lianum]SHM32715.1 hypothetical protein SAMN04488057_10185 [Cyclobacterium lianum]
MTKHQLPAALFISLVFFSVLACTDSGDDFDHAGLYGSWETVDFREEYGLNEVNSLVLNHNGSYQKSITYRDPDTDAIVGYYHFQEGTFTLAGETIAFEAEQDLFIGNEASWGTMEELTEMEINTEAQPVISTLEYRDGGSKLAVITACNDVLLSMCAPHPVYSRVSN